MAADRPSPLRSLKVAQPCPALWENMYGDDKVRFCTNCSLNVYNLSGMTTEDAERLLIEKEGRLCVRYYRREDGTVLTQDCPVGLAALRARARKMATAAATFALSFFAGVGMTLGLRDSASSTSGSSSHFTRRTHAFPEPVTGSPVVTGRVVQGEVAVPDSSPGKRVTR